MATMIAPCGLDCASCPAHVAAMTGDDELRRKTAEAWSKAFGFDCKPEDVNCHGCLATDGVQIGHCKDCGIRACVVGKSLANCAGCSSYGCATIADFWKASPEAKANLERLRS